MVIPTNLGQQLICKLAERPVVPVGEIKDFFTSLYEETGEHFLGCDFRSSSIHDIEDPNLLNGMSPNAIEFVKTYGVAIIKHILPYHNPH